jgi:glycogen operon protein
MPSRQWRLTAGRPNPLGAHWDGDGVNFALFSAHATAVELCLYDRRGRCHARLTLPEHTDGVWHGYVPGLRPGQRYGYRVHGAYDPGEGHRFNPHKLLLDPYARAFDGPVLADQRCHGHRADQPEIPNKRDSASAMPKCIVVDDDDYDWEGDQHPDTPLSCSVIYEMHLGGFTRQHPEVPEDERGTFAGLARPGPIAHLQRLGVTAVELLPVQTFVDEPHLRRQGRNNYWGYNTIGFFAPMARYAAGDDPRTEFRDMVKALHAAGIEVLLDVVYNHTAEGNEHGPTLSFRGIDNASYYSLVPNAPEHYENHSGCGNTLDFSRPRVIQMVMDSLRFWVEEMHVDGFRFDLATVMGREPDGFHPHAGFLTALRQDPTLARTKCIAEPWDIGPGGYQVGAFPPGWSEWNDRFRDSTRAFWVRQEVPSAELAQRLAGSSDLFQHSGRRPQASVNLVTAHDGFTLADLVSYNDKHNEANGQNNDDGHDHNLSWNCGVEGPTDDPDVLALRARLQRNLLATLLVSQGVPMLLSGDELGHSQGGNNNAYCQDNPTTWIDWEAVDADLIAFTQRLIRLRQDHPSLRRIHWLEGEPEAPTGEPDVTWINRQGGEKTIDQWEDPSNHCLGVLLGPTAEEPAILILMNAEAEDVDYVLPDGEWELLLDTAETSLPVPGETVLERRHELVARSLAVLSRVGD